MKTISVIGSGRTEVGKRATNELRKQGMVPCCLYGEKKDENGNPVATAFGVTVEGLRKLIYSPDIFVVELTIDGVAHKAVMREIQFHPVKDNVLHVDFYEITDEKPIVMAVPVKLEGLAAGVRAGGKLVQLQRRLKVKALYTNIPEKLVIDVTSLELAKSIKCGELSFENLELVTPKEALVCSVKATRASAAAAAAAKK